MIALALVSVLCAALASAAPSFDVTSRKATPSDRYLLHVEWSSPSIGATADTVDTPLWAGFNTSAPTFLYVAQEGAGDPKNLRGRVRASTSLATQFRSNGAFIDVVGRAAAGATQRFCGTFTLPYDLSESLIYAPRIDGPYEYKFEPGSDKLLSIEYETVNKYRVCVGNNDYSWWRMATVDFPYVHGLEEPNTTSINAHCRNVWIKRVPVRDGPFEGDIDVARLGEFLP